MVDVAFLTVWLIISGGWSNSDGGGVSVFGGVLFVSLPGGYLFWSRGGVPGLGGQFVYWLLLLGSTICE